METQQQQPNMPQTPSGPQGKANLKDLENFFHSLYLKVPWHLPNNAKEFIVSFGPWVTMIIMIVAIPAILVAIGLTAFFAPVSVMYGGGHVGLQYMLAGLIGLLSLIFEGLALPGLFARSLKGWYFVYYASLLSALAAIIRFDIIGLIIGLAISLYILFEIKSYYK